MVHLQVLRLLRFFNNEGREAVIAVVLSVSQDLTFGQYQHDFLKRSVYVGG